MWLIDYLVIRRKSRVHYGEKLIRGDGLQAIKILVQYITELLLP